MTLVVTEHEMSHCLTCAGSQQLSRGKIIHLVFRYTFSQQNWDVFGQNIQENVPFENISISR